MSAIVLSTYNAQISIYAIISPYNKALHSVIYPQLLYLKLKGQRQEPEQFNFFQVQLWEPDSDDQIIQPQVHGISPQGLPCPQ